MKQREHSFCWMRVLCATHDAAEAPTTAMSEVERCGLFARNGGRPPRIIASLAQPDQSGKVDQPAEAGALEIGADVWSVDPLYGGQFDSAVVLDYGPAFDCHATAREWITGIEGTGWAAESLNYWLVVVSSCKLQPQPIGEVPASSVDNGAKTPAMFVFPWSAWAKSFGSAHLPRRDPSALLLNPDKVPWCRPPDHNALLLECGELLVKQASRRNDDIETITREAQSNEHALAAVFCDSVPGPRMLDSKEGRELLAWVHDSIGPAIFLQKRYFMRARPSHLCGPALQPLFPRRSRLYPGHPSYPSGHATTAHVWAELLARCGAGDRSILHKAAHAVACRRELAGVHFPSDSVAGRELASVLIDMIWDEGNPMRNELFNALRRLGLKP